MPAFFIPNDAAPFLTTHWSMVAACGEQGSRVPPEVAEAALTELCRDYWPPLYSFVRRRGYNPQDAQDLTQGFFAELLESRAYLSTDPAKGKFRSFLLALLKHFLSASRERQSRQKRGGDVRFLFLDEQVQSAEALHERDLATHAPLDEERLFEWNWAAALVNRAMKSLDAQYTATKKEKIFEALRPFVAGGVGLPTHEEVAAQLNIPVETLRSHLSRLRARYRELLRAEVARTVADEQDVEEELGYLCRVLIAAS